MFKPKMFCRSGPHMDRRNGRIGRASCLLLLVGSMLPAHVLLAASSSEPAGAARPDKVMVLVSVDRDGQLLAAPRMFGPLGQSMAMQWSRPEGSAPSSAGRIELTVTATAAGQLHLDTRLSAGQPLQLVAQPRMVTPEGQVARFESRDAEGHVLGVSITARRADAPDLRTAPVAGTKP